MTLEEAKLKHEQLVRLIERYSKEYYVDDNPSVSDAEYAFFVKTERAATVFVNQPMFA